jgi:enoyl-CoA hydratase
VRIVRLNRPDQLNAVNDDLHLSLMRVFPLLSADPAARVAVITGEGRAFSAGGDFQLLDRMVQDRALRHNVIAEGRELVLNMIRCRVPVVAAVNGPAVGLGCSVVALSDVVSMAESAYLSDPHVAVGLVAADGGPLSLSALALRSTQLERRPWRHVLRARCRVTPRAIMRCATARPAHRVASGASPVSRRRRGPA